MSLQQRAQGPANTARYVEFRARAAPTTRLQQRMLGKRPIERCHLADGSQSQQAHANHRWRFGPTPAIQDLQSRGGPLANQPICDAGSHQRIAELATRQRRLARPLHQIVDLVDAEFPDKMLLREDEHRVQHGQGRKANELIQQPVMFRG